MNCVDWEEKPRKSQTFYAKSSNEHHDRITVKEHIEKVSSLAGTFGEEVGMPNAARIAGLFHDFGKYSPAFQRILDGTMQNVDHAFAGAVILYLLKAQKSEILRKKYSPILEAVQGHHHGLVSMDALVDSLMETFQSQDADCCPSGKLPSLRGADAFSAALLAFQADFSDFSFPKIENRKVLSSDSVADMLDTRMLFSCLVDADYSVSASDDDPTYLERNRMPPLDADQMLQNLENHLAQLRRDSTANTELNVIRNQVYKECGSKGSGSMGLFTLTAPTGVGKTLAMLHFALRHCKAHALRRIIVALPFLTLAEQTEREYRTIFPTVLVDHSQSNLPEEMRDLAARWDAPVIITTAVRLFESLFSDNPRDCRKLHNLAGSVILFDESQSLPAELAGVTVQTVQTLCEKFHCSMVFATATQPDFGAIRNTVWKPTEILSNNAELFRKMQRVQTHWRKKLPLADVAEEMSIQKNSCCIVNLRRHARKLFEMLEGRCGSEYGLFLLTTDLCPAHRLAVVAEIRARQKAGFPCLVVATQCIEAGVDLDFDVMYRALAPLESIIQAAGRCNRNGRLPEGGRVIVFIPEEEEPLYPGNWYEAAAHIVENLHQKHAIDIHNPEHIREYYAALFREAKDKKQLTAAIQNRSFSETDKEYQLIANQGIRVIVPYQKMQEDYRDICTQARQYGLTPALIKKAAPITVTVGISQKNKLEDIAEELFYCKQGRKTETKSDFYILFPQNEDFYTEDMGLQLPEQVEFQACW